MTRLLSKSELLVVAKGVSRPSVQDGSIPELLVFSVGLGVGFGLLFATVILWTDTFAIFSLINSQSAPLTTLLVFVVVCSLKFVALAIATAVVNRCQIVHANRTSPQETPP